MVGPIRSSYTFSTYNPYPVAGPSSLPAAPTPAPTPASTTEEPKIPRPPNSWIIFRKKMSEVYKADPERQKIPQWIVSQQISQIWKSMSGDELAVYAQQAEEAKEEHRRKYPNYEYRPRRRMPKERRQAEKLQQREEQRNKRKRTKKSSTPPSVDLPPVTLSLPYVDATPEPASTQVPSLPDPSPLHTAPDSVLTHMPPWLVNELCLTLSPPVSEAPSPDGSPMRPMLPSELIRATSTSEELVLTPSDSLPGLQDLQAWQPAEGMLARSSSSSSTSDWPLAAEVSTMLDMPEVVLPLADEEFFNEICEFSPSDMSSFSSPAALSWLSSTPNSLVDLEFDVQVSGHELDLSADIPLLSFDDMLSTLGGGQPTFTAGQIEGMLGDANLVAGGSSSSLEMDLQTFEGLSDAVGSVQTTSSLNLEVSAWLNAGLDEQVGGVSGVPEEQGVFVPPSGAVGALRRRHIGGKWAPES